jgi:hypothetical protein
MERKAWTAAEIARMSPSQQRAHFRSSIVRDFDQVPQDFLDRVRARIDRRAAETEPPDLP